MLRHAAFLLALLAGLSGCQMSISNNARPAPGGSATTSAASTQQTGAYPAAKQSAQVDDYHGVKVADPYRWLEDLDTSDTRHWIEAENKVTFDYLAGVSGRDTIKQRLTELWNYERYSSPEFYGNRYFYTHNDGLQNQPALYVAESMEATPRLILDPNTLSKD